MYSRSKQIFETDMPLIQLSHQLGDSNQANFGRAFRNWTRISPGTDCIQIMHTPGNASFAGSRELLDSYPIALPQNFQLVH